MQASITVVPWPQFALAELPAMLADVPLAVVEFWAADCLFSRLLAPTRAVLEQRYGSRLLMRRCVVQGAEPRCAELGVSALPALLLFRRGRCVRRWIGEMHFSLVTSVIDATLSGMELR